MGEHATKMLIALKKEGEDYRAILSDDSLDRDDEFMSKELLQTWEKGKSLPMLANHENTMQAFIGAWTDRKLLENDGHTALSMKPNFFSVKANPLSQQIKTQIDEASAKGLEVGLSIGFIPIEGQQTEKGYMHTKAELVEGTVVPVQSNRNSYMMVAKRFNLKAGDKVAKKNEKQNGEGGDEPDMAQAVEDMQSALSDIRDGMDEMDKRLSKLEGSDDNDEEDPENKEGDTSDNNDEEDTGDKKAKPSKKMLKLEKELKEAKAELKKSKETHEALKGKIPKSLLEKIMVSKEGSATGNKNKKKVPYSAAKDYLAKRGIEADEGEDGDEGAGEENDGDE